MSLSAKAKDIGLNRDVALFSITCLATGSPARSTKLNFIVEQAGKPVLNNGAKFQIKLSLLQGEPNQFYSNPHQSA